MNKTLDKGIKIPSGYFDNWTLGDQRSQWAKKYKKVLAGFPFDFFFLNIYVYIIYLTWDSLHMPPKMQEIIIW